MYRFSLLIFLFAGCYGLSSCNSSDDSGTTAGNWTQIQSGFAGVARNSAVSFQIDNTVYVGAGLDSDGDRLKDFWSYNAEAGYWEQLGRLGSDAAAVFPGTARNGAIAFSVNGKGYVGLGADDNDYKADLYQYNPTSRTWKKLADFPGGARRNAIAFTINNKAYVGTGYNGNYLQDMWAYDDAADNWQPVRDFGGSKREGATAFVVGSKAYVGFGSNNGTPQRNLYEYDPEANTWTKKEALDDETDMESRTNAFAFVIGDKAYIGMGTQGGGYMADIWEYIPASDTWTELASITDNCGGGRSFGIGFSYNNQGYITTGYGSGGRLDDFWSFNPLLENQGCD
jgi:N-acetylneuraminic acid mutarotase